jgi:hypothetical protein
MKNLHLIPTEKPSRLYKIENKLGLLEEPNRNFLAKNQHIYITSDEEIKPNTYCLINRVLCKTELLNNKIVSRQLTGGATMDICKSEYLEIILTTDQDLIKDGVQAIDDIFLEWFVENPSCEWVEVSEDYFKPSNVVYGHNMEPYKIIIPQEEPKQETLEESANRLATMIHSRSTDAWYLYKDGIIKGIEYQAKRMYSEEEVQLILSKLLTDIKNGNAGNSVEWFEQFKKKGGEQ